MLELKVLSLAVLGMLSAFSLGCADTAQDDEESDRDVSAEEALNAGVMPGNFLLMSEPNHTEKPCDRITQLQLKKNGEARLKDRPSSLLSPGSCWPAPDNVLNYPRVYSLHLKGTDCGSRIYQGSARDPFAGGWQRIKITDHRTRTCRDLRPALIEVVETLPEPTNTWTVHFFAGTSHLFSQP